MYLLDSDLLSILQRQRGPEFEALADMTVAVKTWMHELYSDDPMIRSESAGFEGNHGGDFAWRIYRVSRGRNSTPMTYKMERSGGLCKLLSIARDLGLPFG